MNKKATVEVVKGASAEQRESARRNRDPLTLMSAEERIRFANKYVVIGRTGERQGRVLKSASTLEDAIRAAQSLPGYRPQDYWVRHVSSGSESLDDRSGESEVSKTASR